MKLNRNDRKEEVAAYTTMILIATIVIILIAVSLDKWM
jgi:preprotein translocase subunit SecE